MGRSLLSTLLLLGLAVGAPAQQGPGCCGNGMGPVAAGARLETIEGEIVQARIAPGLGMPSIVVKSEGRESTILLGPMRYLMAQNFNPKVGDQVVVKAYKTANGWIAGSVTLPQSKRTLRLRDDDGRPVWRGGRW